MNKSEHHLRQLFVIVLTLAMPGFLAAQPAESEAGVVDTYSYRLGGIDSFAEMVHAGVKKLALSAPVSPAEMDKLEPAARRIAEGQGVSVFRETDLIVTDLFPAGVAQGKHVLLLHSGTTLSEYMALKRRKAKLISKGQYEGQARHDIARDFGRLLSYPDQVIADKMAQLKP